MDETESFDKLGPIAQTLAATVVPIDFRENTLKSAIDYLQAISGVQIVVDWNALSLIGVDRDDAVTLQLSAVPLDAAFDLTLGQVGHDIDRPIYEIREDESLVFVSSLDGCRSDTVLVTYDVSSLIEQHLRIEPEVTRQQAAQDLVDTIEETVDPASWVSLGGESGTLRVLGDRLIVSNSRRNHKAISALLASIATGESPRAGDQEKIANESSTVREDSLPAKPPEILQKLKWLSLYGRRHWVWVAVALLLILAGWLLTLYLPTAQSPISSQPPAPVALSRSPRLLVFELRSLSLQEVGDWVEGRRNPTRIELYIADKRIDSGKSLDGYEMRDETMKRFVDGEYKTILGSYDNGFTPFELRIDVIDINESSSDPKPPLLGCFVLTISPSDIGQEMRPAGTAVEYYGDDNVILAVRINWLETG